MLRVRANLADAPVDGRDLEPTQSLADATKGVVGLFDSGGHAWRVYAYGPAARMVVVTPIDP
jgi:hypothetical protein